jgi:hypothetical protein
MRNLALALVALALMAVPARSQSWADKMFGGTTSHDFGSVPRGAQLFHRFTMTNIYAVPLEIVSARTSCGCATVTPSVKVLQPREKATIDVTMDAHRFTGPKTISVYVTVGPEYTSTATLQVSANSRADVVFNPGQVSFGVVPRGQRPVQSIDVEYAGKLDWRVTEVVKNTSDPVDAALEELYRRPGEVGYRIRVTLKADAPAGSLKHEVLLKTNDPASPVVPILVEANVQASLTIAPSTVAFGTVRLGETVTRRIQIRGNKEFRIQSIAGLGDDITVELPATAASVQVITLKYQPRQAGELRRQLTIQTDLSDQASGTVAVEGTAEP